MSVPHPPHAASADAPARARRASFALFAVTIIWGLTFVWMDQGLAAAEQQLGPGHLAAGIGVFLGVRFALAALVLAVCVPSSRALDREAWRGGAWLGGLLFAGFALQMYGLDGVTPAVSAFLTSLYVLFTALIDARLKHTGLRGTLVVGAVLATAGAALIRGPFFLHSAAEGAGFGLAELATVLCALVFAIHILATDHITRRSAPLPVTVTSFLVVVAGSAALVAIDAWNSGPVAPRDVLALCLTPAFAVPLVLSSLLASALAISLMNVFQRDLDPVRAAILYAIEPIWATIAAVSYGTDELGPWLWIGGGLLVAGNLVAEFGLTRSSRAMES